MGRAMTHFALAPPPQALGRDQKVKYNLISMTKSMSKILIPNFMRVLTNERDKTPQTGFSFCRPGHALEVGFGVLKGQIFNSILPSGRYAISS